MFSTLTLINILLLLFLFLAIALWLLSWKKLKKLDNKRKITISEICIKHKITSREKEVLILLLQGHSLKGIEKEIYISINTVRNHVYSIYKKLNVNTRIELLNKLSSDTTSNKIHDSQETT